MTARTTLEVGTGVVFDGDHWTVTRIDGQRVTISRPGGACSSVLLAHLVGHPDFRLSSDATGPAGALGPVFDRLPAETYRALRAREEDLREVLTGYRSGDSANALPHEPRPAYHPGLPLMERYAAKAAELGVSVSTIRRQARQYSDDGIVGLLDRRQQRPASPTGRVDRRWISAARTVLAEHIGASQPTRLHIIDRTNARVRAEYGDDVRLPSEATARRVLAEITRGAAAFSGSSAKAKRSIAHRPGGPYGQLRAARPGEVVLLDTTPLDVYGMDRVTLRWLSLQLTVAMDVATRSILALRLSPVSAKAIDTALVLYEAISPRSRSHTSRGLLPYGGVPDYVLVNDDGPGAELPGCAIDTIVIDHGKMYTAAHVRVLCERLGISIQPGRKFTPTDKAAIERFFRTLREDLLVGLPGYKGPDVYSRGEAVEEGAYYFSSELEAIIREWVADRYHTKAHQALCVQSVPGLDVSPREMWDLLAAQHGVLEVPARPDLVYDFLPVEWRRINHDGIRLNLRYDGPGLDDLRDASSPFGAERGKWPVRFDPDDIRQVYLQRPDDQSWHVIPWVHRDDIDQPFSEEALAYARRLAVTDGRHHDDRDALLRLFERWGSGLAETRHERRLMLRQAEQRASRVARDKEAADGPAAPAEPEWGRVLPMSRPEDDPIEDDLDENVSDEDFYGDAYGIDG